MDSEYSVEFQGNDLSLIDGVELYNHEFNSLPNRDIKINKIARRDKSVITSSEYTQKNIPVWMEVCSGTRADTEDLLTFVKSLLQYQNGTLSVLQGGVAVDYVATMQEFDISWEGVKALVMIVFLASDPIGRESESQTLVDILSITTATASSSMIVSGSATAYPVITVTINSITGGTTKQVTIANGKTNQGITIERTWSALDVLIIDSDELSVTVNGSIVDFTGMFPQFPAGSGMLTYLDNFTTRNVNLTSTYNPRLV